MDEPESIVLSDLFIPQVGTPRLREGTHFLVGRWAGHAINFLKELLFFFFFKQNHHVKVKSKSWAELQYEPKHSIHLYRGCL